MIKTKITDLLGIEYPIIQGGMAWIADAKLAAAVSNAGGLGLIGSANAPADVVRAMIREAKSLTTKPFGVNIMLLSPHRDAVAEVCIEEKVAVVTTGAGSPGKYIPAFKEAGIKVIPVVPSVALAMRVEKQGADAVVVEGTEAGGHIGELTTMALTPQVVDAVQIPVIAAGGIADGRGMAAVMMLGAQGVQMGTIFICTDECNAHEEYKNMLLKAGDTDTVATGRGTGHPVRCLKNKFTKTLLTMEKNNATLEEFEEISVGSYRKAVQEGDRQTGTFMAGQIAGLVTSIRPVAAVVADVAAQAEALLRNPQEQGGFRFE